MDYGLGLKPRLLRQCTNPQYVWRDKKNHRDALKVPCGKCDACRFRRSYEWKTRLVYEAKGIGMENCVFLTLTYCDSYCDGSLHKDHLQDFLKRLRYYFDSMYGKKLRFYACGEYGTHTYRPHYHLIVFGVSPDEYNHVRTRRLSENMSRIYASLVSSHATQQEIDLVMSDIKNNDYKMDDLWPFGHTQIGTVTDASIGYVCGYVVKDSPKVDGSLDPFRLMSRRPGLGLSYILSHKDDVMFRRSLSDSFVALPRFVEDKLFPKGTVERQIRDDAKEVYLLKLKKLHLDAANCAGKDILHYETELRSADAADLKAISSLFKKDTL